MNHHSESDAAHCAPVLIVNDDRIQLEMFAGILRRSGIACDTMTSAEQALDDLKPDSPPPLIISDLHMPGIDGWRFCRLLRSHEYAAFNHVPVLVVSATFAGEDAREITAATGANAFLPAPVNPEQFLATVQGLIEGSNPELHRARALLVDDSPTALALLSRAFDDRGYEVITAADAAQARRLFNTYSPEIVVLDYHLPDGCGEDLLSEFSQAGHFSVLVMITTDPGPELALRWMKMGAAAYARKPFDPEYLLTLCEAAARERVMMRVEEMLEHKTQCLAQAQKMEAVGQLAGGVAHDFNNLLQVISGYTEMALMDLDDRTEVSAHLAEVLNAAGRARQFVEQLLAFSRRQATRPESVDLPALLNKEMTMLRRMIGEHIALNSMMDEDMPAVHADPHQIEQALMNLCINARDAMPEGGRLTLELTAVELDGEYCASHRWARPGRYVCLAVADTGCGMSPEVRARIFEPFFTTKEMGKGTGLGLSTVYGIVKQNDGFIHVYSEPGHGTVFRLYLPAAETEAGTQCDTNPDESAHVLGGNETLLLAEDESQVRAIAARHLSEAGYTILTAANGDEAIGILEEHGPNLDLLVLDVVMPKKNGRMVLEAARKRGLSLPALFVSGYSYDHLNSAQLPVGAMLLQKPFSRRDLLKSVRAAIESAARQ